MIVGEADQPVIQGYDLFTLGLGVLVLVLPLGIVNHLALVIRQEHGVVGRFGPVGIVGVDHEHEQEDLLLVLVLFQVLERQVEDLVGLGQALPVGGGVLKDVEALGEAEGRGGVSVTHHRQGGVAGFLELLGHRANVLGKLVPVALHRVPRGDAPGEHRGGARAGPGGVGQKAGEDHPLVCELVQRGRGFSFIPVAAQVLGAQRVNHQPDDRPAGLDLRNRSGRERFPFKIGIVALGRLVSRHHHRLGGVETEDQKDCDKCSHCRYMYMYNNERTGCKISC